MEFRTIDKDDWERKEYFSHYFLDFPCTYSMSTKLDITKLKNAKCKLYPTMLYWITKIVNKHREFRMSLDKNGQLGFFDKVLPCYTVFHKDTETFSNIWTEYFDDYSAFCMAYENDLKKYGTIHSMFAKPDRPDNSFPVSMIPWTSFDGFNLNLKKGHHYILPIFTIGKFYKKNSTYRLPFSIHVHHAVCDGFHVCRFVNELQDCLLMYPPC